MPKKVIVGMSGGVDSAVAAHLLKEQGYDVSGVFMKNWDDSEPNSQCPAQEDFEDVRKVCEIIDIPYYSVNFENEYWERVFDYFLREYHAGRTPNPDVLCNREIKFAAFLDFALDAGADYIATGHYARTAARNGETLLEKGLDPGKDQSYFLCLLKERQLEKTLFPLGEMNKSEVRGIAREKAFPIAEKKDSTGICFIGERRFKNFLQTYIPANPGETRTLDGRVLGVHDGLMYYTLGQRRGLNIGGRKDGTGERWFVVGKDLENNVLYVSQGADSELLYSRALCVEDMSFIGKEPGEEFDCAAKVRYRQPDQNVRVKRQQDGFYYITFDQRQRAVTPGQYCVLYDGDVCLGGGAISKVYAETEVEYD